MSATTDHTGNNKLVYWIILAIFLLSSLILGILGFRSYFILNHIEFNWVRSLYCTLQLFVLENGEREGHIPLILNLARFTAPLTTVLAVVLALFEWFKTQWKRILISFMQNHTVIIGFGTKGKNVMMESVVKKEKIVVIDSDPFNPNLALIRSPRCHFLCADASHEITLVKAGIPKAKTVFLLLGDDTQQVRICLLIYQIIKKSRRNEMNPLSCIMHLQRPEFLITMRNHKIVSDKHDGLQLNIFNVYENSARELFEENPPDRSGIPEQSDKIVQIVIFGFGNAGEALALQTALTGHYLNGRKPRVLIIDRFAKDKVADFQKRYPTFTDYCLLEYLAFDANSPRLIPEIVKKTDDPLLYTTMVLCFDNKTQNLLLGLQLESIRMNNTSLIPQVFVRTNDNEPFEAFSNNIKPYGLPSKVCSREVITDSILDRKARSIHQLYLKKRGSEPDFGTREADVPWEDLSEEYRDSNRKAADHIGIKMRGIGCEIVSIHDPRPAAVLTKDETEKLSELEHRRWCADRSLAGWTYHAVKNAKTRQTPYLTEWINLPPAVQDYDREVVIDIPIILEKVGLKAARTGAGLSLVR